MAHLGLVEVRPVDGSPFHDWHKWPFSITRAGKSFAQARSIKEPPFARRGRRSCVQQLCGRGRHGRSHPCSRAMRRARSLACGSARSCIQPCVSPSRMASASSRMPLAHPSMVRKAGRRSLVINMSLLQRSTRRIRDTRLGFRRIAQSWDSISVELSVFHLFRAARGAPGTRLLLGRFGLSKRLRWRRRQKLAAGVSRIGLASPAVKGTATSV
jgi:hypothetical protein